MIEWLKRLFDPKTLPKKIIDALDLLVPFLALELERVKEQFAKLNSKEKAQWIVDYIQIWLRRQFGITE